jgi:hypothetical protein
VSARILRTKAVGVVVPVHNEAALLGDALDALKVAFTHLRNTGIPSLLTLVFDSCDDQERGRSTSVDEGTLRTNGVIRQCHHLRREERRRREERGMCGNA